MSRVFFQGLLLGIQNNLNEQPNTPISDKNNLQISIVEKKSKNRTPLYVAGIFGTFILVGFCILGIWIMLQQRILIIPAIGKSLVPVPTKTIVSPCNADLLSKVEGIQIFPSSPTISSFKAFQEYQFISRFDTGSRAKGGSLKWEIYPRSDYGCVITLTGDVNGIPTIAYSWFVDLDTRRVLGDNPNAQDIQYSVGSSLGDDSFYYGFLIPK
jgi:hypothetical protein